MYTSAIKTGMRYLAASIVIAAAAAVYGLFSHGVYSYFMTYAFMVPLLAGALPHLTAALKTACGKACGSLYEKISGAKDAQLALVATLTAGSLLKACSKRSCLSCKCLYDNNSRKLSLAAAECTAAGKL